ncbi:MAG: peptide chain release factor N(5)-glutamine methyltransferase [Lactobacillus sp.]|nr:peptide chain release factor N(5)-glutamine methyltransferase [Lactobacillus sp.]
MPKITDFITKNLQDFPNIKQDDLEYVITERMELTPSEFEMKKSEELTDDLAKQLKKDLKKLNRGVSPQYIIGYSWFYGMKIEVQRGVLIPRFETEELVHWASENVKADDRVLDLGTGSGCITVALHKLAKEKNLAYYASDISDTALRVAEENFLTYGVDAIVRKANILIGLEKFDCIISNPPYIKETEKGYMDQNVLENEPNEALFAGEDGLAFYKRFAKQVTDHLNPGGQFFLEFGFQQKEDLEKLLTEALPNFEFEFKKDMAGHWRMVHGKMINNEN